MKNNIKNIKGFVLGFGCCALLTSGIAYAADAVKLDAYFGVKLMQNGIDKTPQEDDLKPFIANGRTYVPLKAVGDLLGVDVNWDGANTAVVIGKRIEGTPLELPAVSLGDPSNSSMLIQEKLESNQTMTINKKNYGNIGFSLTSAHSSAWAGDSGKGIGNIVYLKFTPNNQFSSLVLSLGMDDINQNGSYGLIRNVTFKDQNGNVLKDISLGKGSIQEAISINLKGVVGLQVEVTGAGRATVDFINPILK
ncbi:hypothetical protein QFZ81_000998 [Paenibacillus sp. V4I9]|uniref:stalk domain-containing protein n=1 Tax=Paenibacillus sp. V4I9 TaxID=3042308 RepID=UPI002785A3FC|nr:stalk domain-containing protein [Paenibacillus sp. V4I9]MDQ0885910.1 hypothetical protein [Paenibacillus sp. V4I9]